MAKRIVVWGTGFVGRMVIAEVVKHPNFELVGVGVSNPDKVGRDAGEVCGIGDIGHRRHGGRRGAGRAEAGCTRPLRPDGRAREGQHPADLGVPAGGIDVVSTAMTPWVWPSMKQNPSHWIEPITQACEEGGASCFTTGIDPGFANDLFPMTLMGLCAEIRTVRALELLDYVNYTGDYEVEMGIGRPPEFQALLEHTDILVMSWGATVPMIAHAAGIELDEITTTWEKWVTDVPIDHGEGRHQRRRGRGDPLHDQRRLQRRDADPARARQPDRQRRGARLAARDAERRLSRRDRRVAVHHAGDGVPVHRRKRARRGRRRVPRHGDPRAQRRARRQRAPAGVGDGARPPAHRRRGNHQIEEGSASEMRSVRMDWSFTEEQEQVAGLTRQILERELSEERMREVEHGRPVRPRAVRAARRGRRARRRASGRSARRWRARTDRSSAACSRRSDVPSRPSPRCRRWSARSALAAFGSAELRERGCPEPRTAPRSSHRALTRGAEPRSVRADDAGRARSNWRLDA